MNSEQSDTTFVLNAQSQQRNKTALRTVRGLIFIFTLTVIVIRVGHVLSLILLVFSVSQPLFYLAILIFLKVAFIFGSVVFYLNNVLNIFIYSKMIPGFRKFLLSIFTFGLFGRMTAVTA